MRFVADNRVGLTCVVIEYAVEEYKSIDADLHLATPDVECKTEKEQQMTLKRPQ